MWSRIALKRTIGRRGVRGLSTAAAAKPGSWSFDVNPIPSFNRERQGLLDMVLGRSKMPQVPLNVPVQLPKAAGEIKVNGAVQVSSLANGVRVASREYQAPVATVGVFVNTGARDESADTNGISHFLETAAFGTTLTRTDFRLIRDLSRIGANLSITAGRESIAYTGEVLANWTRPVAETLGDIVKRPYFIDFELRDLVNHYREHIEEREHDHAGNLLEHVHGAAYGYSTLGRSLYAPIANLQNFKRPEVLQAFHKQFFTADRISFVALGVPHEYAVELAEQEFGELPADVVSPKREAAAYVGGDVRMHASPFVPSAYDAENAHIAFAWKADTADAVVLSVMRSILTDKAAAGPTPSRAVNSRLNSRIVASGIAHSSTSFANVYSDSALFGVYGAVKSADAANAAYALLAEAQALTSVSAEELARAKLLVKHSIASALDSRSALIADIGAQLSRGASISSVQSAAAAVDAITAEDVKRVASKMLKTQLTVAASGDLSRLPRYDQLAAKL